MAFCICKTPLDPRLICRESGLPANLKNTLRCAFL